MPIKTETEARAATAAAFQAADDAWQVELERLFGRNAGDLRYTSHGRGEKGSDLRSLFDARSAAHNAWLAANNCGPATA